MYFYFIEIITISALASVFYKCYKKENNRINRRLNISNIQKKKNNLDFYKQDYISNQKKNIEDIV